MLIARNKMKTNLITRLFIIGYLLLANLLIAQSNKVYIGTIEGDIDLGLAPYVRRVISEAEQNNAKAVLFKINTFGGRVDAATQIKDAILNSNVMTIAFIDKRAISAGALISLSCEKIIMVPGASIGATTVVDGAGQKQSEKYQSYMRSEMRATAEKNGRRTDIAEGMVDEKVIVPELKDDSTTLITLTAKEAAKYLIADSVLASEKEALEAFGITNPQFVTISANWAEDVVRFLNNPIISSLLIMIGLVGLFTEIKTPGWGFAGTAAIIALALFFGTSYILQLASVIEILLFFAGVILLILEIFVIPGFGIFGIAGIVMMVLGLFLGLLSDFELTDFSFVSFAVIQLAIIFVASAVLIFILYKFLPKSHAFQNLVLHSNIGIKTGFSNQKYSFLLNSVGESYTDLRPSGIVVIDGAKYDVVTEGDYILKGTPVKVIKIEGSRIVVAKT
jgi:membrane-bound serine protease (ClpP class)